MQGRYKRDGSASAEPEPHGGTGRGSSTRHAQNPGPRPSDGGEPRAAGSSDSSASLSPPSVKPSTQSSPQPSTGHRLAFRNWRISTRLVSLVALPVVAATTLGALRINQSMEEMEQLDNVKLLTDMTKRATELATALQTERDESAGPLAHGATSIDLQVQGPREKTDQKLQEFLDESARIQDSDGDASLAGVRSSIVQITSQLTDLKDYRENAFDDSVSLTVDAYSQLVQQLLALTEDMAQATGSPEMLKRTRALTAFSAAKEYASVERAVIAAALPPSSKEQGHLDETDRVYAKAAHDKYRFEFTVFDWVYEGNSEAIQKQVEKSNPTVQEADLYAQRVLGQPDGLKYQPRRSYQDWVEADTTKIDAMATIEKTLLNDMEEKARELRSASERSTIISGALIVLVLGISLVGAFLMGRSMIRSLRRLQDTATRVAQDRLPELVKQLSESDPQDVDTSVESVGLHSRDEIGKVAAAFDDVHREAVRLAAEQALLRGNVNAMFTNLSRRSQGLIQRQLSLISELESREADPDQLSSLFKLDHLATRMRRNGENLLVLAGEEPGRRWTRPVPLVDVLRAAASEVEQYERIELAAVPATEVAGRVVNDLVHLLAELLENATSFSSPQTKVKVTGHALPDGRVLVEIHDTGIGLSPEDLASINERLAAPPTVDVSVSRRMGLFVVGRLSQRHGIRIQLRPSDSGGTTALVMLPVDVAQGGRRQPAKGGAPTSGGPAAAQAAAGAAAARRSTGAGAGANTSGGERREQVGAGSSVRAALPSRDVTQGGPRPGPGGPLRGGPQSPAPKPQQDTPVPASMFGQDSGAPAVPSPGGIPATGEHRDGFSDDLPTSIQSALRRNASLPAQRTGEADKTRRPQLPQRDVPRAELPGGTTQPAEGGPRSAWNGFAAAGSQTQGPEEPAASPFARSGDRTGGFSAFDDRQGPGSTAEIPRIDDAQGPGSTGQFARPTFGGSQDTGQFARQDLFTPASGGPARREPAEPAATGQFQAFDAHRSGDGVREQDRAAGRFMAPPRDNLQDTGSFQPFAPAQGNHATDGPQQPAPNGDPGDTGSFAAPQFDRGRMPLRGVQQRPDEEALPPATGPGDGRTPLYDTLETNWFRGGRGAGLSRTPAASGTGQRPGGGASSGPGSFGGSRGPGGFPGTGGPSAANGSRSGGTQPAAQPLPDGSTWRPSPNDELVRQAEKTRQPTAGGVTTSGLPRRVPRANLVAGAAQEPQHHAGPQVSRAPDAVRGRLTNLRRGIQQGRQAGTGSHPRPTHQQER